MSKTNTTAKTFLHTKAKTKSKSRFVIQLSSIDVTCITRSPSSVF